MYHPNSKHAESNFEHLAIDAADPDIDEADNLAISDIEQGNLEDVELQHINCNKPPPISDTEEEESEMSDSRMCRYCFCEIKSEQDNYSSCACKTSLCRDCLERELCLTEGRQDHTMKCTVCQTQYSIEYLTEIAPSFLDILKFSLRETFCCGYLQIQGVRVPSLRERIALTFLMTFLSIWTLATSFSIADPGIDKFNGFSAELLVYLFLVFMDWCVGFSMIWFIKLVESLQLTLPFALMMLHGGRSLAVITIRFIVDPLDDVWKFVGCCGMIVTSLCVISSCARLYVMTAMAGYRRVRMRTVSIMVGGKGPFRLTDINRAHRGSNPPANDDPPSPQQPQQQEQQQEDEEEVPQDAAQLYRVEVHEAVPMNQ